DRLGVSGWPIHHGDGFKGSRFSRKGIEATGWHARGVQFVLAGGFEIQGPPLEGICEIDRRSWLQRHVALAFPTALPRTAGTACGDEAKQVCKGPGSKGSNRYTSANGRHYEGSVHVDGIDP